MAYNDTALQADVQRVIHSNSQVYSTYAIEIHCGTSTTVITPLKLLSIDTLHDYEKGFAEEKQIEVILVENDYQSYIFPNRDNLKITVIRSPIGVVSDSKNYNGVNTAKTYRATLVDPSPARTNEGKGFASAQGDYSSQMMISVKFQLIDLAVEQMMLTTTGGIFRNSTPGNTLKALLTTLSQSLKLDDADAVKGVNMIDADNLKQRTHLLVDQGTKLYDLADHIHQNCGGIYNTGVSCYYHANYWHVFPPYDVTRINKSTKTMTLMLVRTPELPDSDSTYLQDGNTLYVVSNGTTLHIDQVDHQAVNAGNGVRYARATDLFDNFIDTTKQAMTASTSNVMNAFITNKRDSGLSNAPFSKNRVTDNDCVELSKLAQRQGQQIQVQWDKADPSLIIPGMPVKVLYESERLVYQLVGTILNVQSQVRMNQPGMTTVRYVTGVSMTLFVTVDKTSTAA
jgi:hypothetical protein